MKADDVKVICAHTEMVPINELKPHPENPNTHPDKQIKMLAKIIKSQGFRVPITVSNRSGYIIRGHARLKASLELGITKVPVDFQDYDSDVAEYADLIADNKIAELSSVDKYEVAAILNDPMFDDFDIGLTGFMPKELELPETAKISDVKYKSVYFEPIANPNLKLSDCINLAKYKEKNAVLQDFDLTEEQLHVLKFLTYRFIRIDFELLVTYYYFNATDEEKKAIERLRCVLVDDGIDGFIEDDILCVYEAMDFEGAPDAELGG